MSLEHQVLVLSACAAVYSFGIAAITGWGGFGPETRLVAVCWPLLLVFLPLLLPIFLGHKLGEYLRRRWP